MKRAFATRSHQPRGMALPPPVVPIAEGGLGYEDLLHDPTATIVALVLWDAFVVGDTVMIVGPRDQVLGTTLVTEDTDLVFITMAARDLVLLGNGEHALFTVYHSSFGSESVSARSLDLRIKLDPPGGFDPEVGTPYINENLDLPVVVPASIDPGTPSATVTVPVYENMAAGDTVTLRWGHDGNDLESSELTEAEVGQPVVFDVPRSVIDAGGVGFQNVNYQVYDVVSNWSKWSPAAVADIDDPDAFNAPYVKESQFVGTHYELDMTTLGSADATAQISEGRIRAGDAIVLHVSGTTANGAPITYDSDPIVVLPGQVIVEHALPNDVFARMVQSHCQIWYVVARSGERRLGSVTPGVRRRLGGVRAAPLATFTSRRFALTITGSLAALKAPDVREADGDTIDPAKVTGGAHVLIEANPVIAPDTTVEYRMVGTGALGNTVFDEGYRDITASTTFPLTFVTPGNKIAAAAGGTATFAYTVIAYTQPALRRLPHRRVPRVSLPSPEHTFRILGGEAPKLTAPVATLAADGAIDPDVIDDAMGVQVEVHYDDMVSGDVIHLSWQGSMEATPFKDTLTYRDRPVSFYVPKSHLVANVGGTVTLDYTAVRGTDTRQSEDVTYVVGSAAPLFEIDGSAVELTVAQTYARNATGGKPPYGYTSNMPAIVRVPDATKGDIEAVTAGDATITASDAAGATGSYPVHVTGGAIVLRKPVPDFIASGAIGLGQITDSRGLRVVVKAYEGMAAGQTIELSCLTALGTQTPAAQTVDAIGDYEFFIPKSFLTELVAELDPAMAGFLYRVTAAGQHHTSPRNDVTFHA